MSLVMSFHMHTNVGSRDDGYCSPDEMCRRIKELGGKAACLTDHGTFVALWDFLDACRKYGLKPIVGVEGYEKNPELLDSRRHIVLIAKSFKGYEAISKIVSETAFNNEDGFPIMTDEMLYKWFGPGAPGHGEVIATTACMWGMCNALLLQNNKFQHEIDKILRKQGERPDIEKYQGILKAIEDADAETKVQRAQRDRNKLKSGDKNLYDSAVQRLEELKDETKKLKLQRDELKAPVEKYLRYEDQISELKAKFVSPRTAKKQAKEELIKMRDIFGEDNIYVELQYHGIPDEAKCFPIMLDLSKELHIPVIAGNDAHMATKDQAEGRQMLFVNRYGWKELEESDKELYIKSDEELAEWLKKILPEKTVKEAIANVAKVVEMCNVKFTTGSHYPKFPCKEGGLLHLRSLIAKNKRKRVPEWNDTYQQRLTYELSVIEKMGFSDYLCIVQDFIQYGKIIGKLDLSSQEFLDHRFDINYLKIMASNEVGVGIGPGRGSACGSLICYIIGITDIDPIRSDLLFERFLNPNRVTMPDIDTDVSVEARQFVIEYIKHQYGEKAVCQILTIGYYGAKSSIQAGARCLGKKLGDDKMFTSLAMEMTKGIEDANAPIDDVEESILQNFGSDKHVPEILKLAKWFEGRVSNYGTHAAGIVVSDNDDVSDYLPLIRVTSAVDCSCDLTYVEPLGMLKLDLLGLRNLSIITSCLKEIRKTTGQMIDISDIADEPEVYGGIFANGNTNGVFQFESPGMKKTLVDFGPESIDDLTLLVAVYRPGPMQYIESITKVKKKEETPVYIVPEMEEILAPTYGKPVYQEQIMAIFNKVAGFSLGEADIIRRHMAKKHFAEFAAYKDQFIQGLIAKGADPDACEEFWNQLLDFSAYAFNKSHARAYAQVSYITAWLKYHFPEAYYVGLLNYTDTDKRESVLKDAVANGVEVVTPDINLAEETFTLNQSKQIVYGLSYISMVAGSAKDIIEERRNGGTYISFEDFLQRINPRKNVLENLIKAGSFDSICSSREALLIAAEEKSEAIADYKKWAEKLEADGITDKRRTQIEAKLREFEEVISTPIKSLDDNRIKNLMAEREVIGSFISDHPVPKSTGYKTLAEIAEKDNAVVFISSFETKISKNGNTYGQMTIEDRSGAAEARIFAKSMVGAEDILKEGSVVKANISRKEDGSIIINKVENFKVNPESVTLMVPSYDHFIKNEKYLANYKGDKHLIIYCKDVKKYYHTKYFVCRDVLESERFRG